MSKPVYAMNLSTGVKQMFDEYTDPKYAVCFAYCSGGKPGLFAAFMKAIGASDLSRFYSTLPFSEGEKTIACGDWCALKMPGIDYGQT